MLVGAAGLGDGIRFVVALVVHILAQILVVDLMAVLALCDTNSLSKFDLSLALNLDGVVSGLEGSQKICFRHFVHLAFHHHYVVVSCADHKFHICFLKLFERRVDHKFAVDTCHTNL